MPTGPFGLLTVRSAKTLFAETAALILVVVAARPVHGLNG
jgi:hypothetical protein